MKKLFAIPTENKKLCAHFGHCEKFAIIETEDSKIINSEFVNPPAHEPGTFPKFLSEMGVETIIAGGMGQRALDLFAQNNIEVVMGVGSDEPEKLVNQYLSQNLESGNNLCDEDHHGHNHH